MSRDVERLLEDLGSQPVPGPSPRFADSLESDLRVMVATSTAVGPGMRFGRWPATLAAAGFTIAVVVFAVASLASGPTQVYISHADQAEVILPSGDRIPATPGVALPSGALVEVGDSGSVTIGEETFGQNSIVVVNGDDVSEVDDADDIAAIVSELPPSTIVTPTLGSADSASGSAPSGRTADSETGGEQPDAPSTTVTAPPTSTTQSSPTTHDAGDVVVATSVVATTAPTVLTTQVEVTTTLAGPTDSTPQRTTTTAVGEPTTTTESPSSTTTTTALGPGETTTTTTTDDSPTSSTSSTTSTTIDDSAVTTTSVVTTTTEGKVDVGSVSDDPVVIERSADQLEDEWFGAALLDLCRTVVADPQKCVNATAHTPLALGI